MSIIKEFLIEEFNGRLICIKGIGKLFYQNGFPIPMSISILKDKRINVSILHIADECLKVGWKPTTVFNKLKCELLEDNIDGIDIDIDDLKLFCFSEYEVQREMIFKYLFNTNSSETNINSYPSQWLLSNYIPI